MSGIYMKHSFTDARDCLIEWEADFAKMTLDLKVAFISPCLLLDFFKNLRRFDERFEKTGIIEPMQIDSRFKISLTVAEQVYRVNLYMAYVGGSDEDGKEKRSLEIELFPI